MKQYLGAEILAHLRISVLVGYFVVWNLIWLAGVWLGGSATSRTAHTFFAVELLGTALIALAIAHTEPAKRLTLRSRSNLPGLARELRAIAVLTGLMGLGFLAMITIERA